MMTHDTYLFQSCGHDLLEFRLFKKLYHFVPFLKTFKQQLELFHYGQRTKWNDIKFFYSSRTELIIEC